MITHQIMFLLAAQTSALPAGVPGSLAESAGPSTSSASLSLLAYILSGGVSGVCGAKGALRGCTRSGGKPSGDEGRRVDEFATSAVLWPKLGQELIQVCCDQASSLVQSGLRRRHNEGHGKHGVRQVLRGERDNEVAELPVGVLLGVRIREGQSQSTQEEGAIHANA
jgi:hypothetical protein